MKRILAFCLVAIGLTLTTPSFASPPDGDLTELVIAVPVDYSDLEIDSVTVVDINPEFAADLAIVTKEAHVGDVLFSDSPKPDIVDSAVTNLLNTSNDSEWYPLYNWYICNEDVIDLTENTALNIEADDPVPIQRE